jgi:uncharacterized membrane protein
MSQDFFEFVFRWFHFVAGITWIGLLYFFNFINTPNMKVIDASARPHITTTLLPRALFWFRHAAWITVLFGLAIIAQKYWARGDFATTDSAKTILLGGLLGIAMAGNVWFAIWPNQKKIIEATRNKQTPDPAWARVALYASRANVIMSWPMLAFMAGASHYPLDWPRLILVLVILMIAAALFLFYVQKAWNFTPKAA